MRRRAAYHNIPELVRKREPFENSTGSMSAVKHGRKYVVYSYGTVIGIDYGNGVRAVNENHYSPTTSRQQNLLRACGYVKSLVMEPWMTPRWRF